MRFRDEIVQRITEGLAQRGFKGCPICRSRSLSAHHIPVLLHVGGLTSIEDPDANVLLMLRVTCEACGHAMLFDSEQHHGPDEPVLEGEPPA